MNIDTATDKLLARGCTRLHATPYPGNAAGDLFLRTVFTWKTPGHVYTLTCPSGTPFVSTFRVVRPDDRGWPARTCASFHAAVRAMEGESRTARVAALGARPRLYRGAGRVLGEVIQVYVGPLGRHLRPGARVVVMTPRVRLVTRKSGKVYAGRSQWDRPDMQEWEGDGDFEARLLGWVKHGLPDEALVDLLLDRPGRVADALARLLEQARG